jgi:hypothetical protein
MSGSATLRDAIADTTVARATQTTASTTPWLAVVSPGLYWFIPATLYFNDDEI